MRLEIDVLGKKGRLRRAGRQSPDCGHSLPYYRIAMPTFFRRLIIWAVDGPGSHFQGRAALGVAVVMMVLPALANVVGMQVFGYDRGSPPYRMMTGETILFWVPVLLYLVSILIFGPYRIFQTLADLLQSFKKDRAEHDR